MQSVSASDSLSHVGPGIDSGDACRIASEVTGLTGTLVVCTYGREAHGPNA